MNSKKDYNNPDIPDGRVSWRSPSNIAIIKYWGKKGQQQPLSPSLSMTLRNSYTETSITYGPSPTPGEISFSFLFEGMPRPAFSEKINKYLEKLSSDFEFIKQSHLIIESENSFPHSAGIASSASAMSAVALCILSIAKRLDQQKLPDNDFLKMTSHYARIGSGSACRSVFPGWAMWGETALFPNSSQLHAIGVNEMVHPAFRDMQDSILIVKSGPKEVSSSRGHELMNNHPFLQQRLKQAHQNLEELKNALITGDIDTFMMITEIEAYSLHSLMKSSNPGFILTQPNTLKIIEKFNTFREESGIKACFTLDAGPNVHLLYPLNEKQKVLNWISTEVIGLCEDNQWIDDEIGKGPKLILNEIKI